MSISLVYLRCFDYGYLQSSQEGQGPCLFGIFRSITVVYGLKGSKRTNAVVKKLRNSTACVKFGWVFCSLPSGRSCQVQACLGEAR